jgi:DNA-binding GntR family transcriptional regulator
MRRSAGDHIMVIEKKIYSLGHQVADILSADILEGNIRGGDRLIEQELQARFGVSRSPLREAFRDLEKKGLVEIVPRRGTFVKLVTRKDIIDHFPVRAALEGLAAALAHRSLTDLERESMKRELAAMEAAVGAGDTGRFHAHHLAYHELFINGSGNPLLIDTLKTLRMQAMWHRFSYQYYQEDLQRSYRVHARILDMLLDPGADLSRLRELVEDHINRAVSNFLHYVEQHETSHIDKTLTRRGEPR